MYRIFKALLVIVWVVDILNLPQMEFLDTTYPINTMAWLLIWLFIPSSDGRPKITAKIENKEN